MIWLGLLRLFDHVLDYVLCFCCCSVDGFCSLYYACTLSRKDTWFNKPEQMEMCASPVNNIQGIPIYAFIESVPSWNFRARPWSTDSSPKHGEVNILLSYTALINRVRICPPSQRTKPFPAQIFHDMEWAWALFVSADSPKKTWPIRLKKSVALSSCLSVISSVAVRKLLGRAGVGQDA